MKLFRHYLRQRRQVLGLFTLFCGFYALTAGLYRLPSITIFYPMALCALTGCVALAVDFFRVRQLYQVLQRILEDPASLLVDLPSATGVEEEAYQAILHRLVESRNALRTQSARQQEDTIHYYTTWAHQIKTPIASMRLQLQAEDSPLSRRLQGDLFRVEQYVEMVLMYLRLDSTDSDYVIRECELDPILRQSVKKFAGEFILRQLRLDFTPTDLRILTDEKWLSFVVEQVLSNALKYTPSGGIRIYVETPATLCIADTGMGIAPEDLPRIFERGYTGYHGRADKKASGIGLYLCRRICRNLGHTITAESTPGEGTVIRLNLYHPPLEIE